MFLTIKETCILWNFLYELTEKLLTDDLKKNKIRKSVGDLIYE